jgi:hypothetical protein
MNILLGFTSPILTSMMIGKTDAVFTDARIETVSFFFFWSTIFFQIQNILLNIFACSKSLTTEKR